MKLPGQILAAVTLAIVIVSVDRRLHPLEPEAATPAPARRGELKGEILSVRGDVNRVREAFVKLNDGQTVRASVPPACAVFEGEVARLERRDADYWIVHTSEKKT